MLAQKDWKVLGQVNLPNMQGKMILICKPDWVGQVLNDNYQLLGFLPCAITVFKKDNDVLIGTGQPAIIKALAQSEHLQQLAANAESQIKNLIHEAAGIEDLKPTQVKLYSTMSCPYCKMEKSWLEDKKIKHEIVYVDRNTDEAQKMVEKTGQMGVPVTEIRYENNQTEYIIGFDRPRLANLLGVSQ